MLKRRTLLITGLLFIVSLVLSVPAFTYAPFVAEVSLGGTYANKIAIYASNDHVDLTVTLVTSSDVPKGASARVDIIDYGNPDKVHYSITPASRYLVQTLEGGGVSKKYTFRLTTNDKNLKTGTVTLQFRLNEAIGASAVEPLTREISIPIQAQGNSVHRYVSGFKGIEADFTLNPD
jgi:hypothetical protein